MAPAGTARSIPATARVAPNDFARPVASIASGPVVVMVLLRRRADVRGTVRREGGAGERISGESEAPRDSRPGTSRWTGRASRYSFGAISPSPVTAKQSTPELPMGIRAAQRAGTRALLVETGVGLLIDRGYAGFTTVAVQKAA